MGSGGAPAEAAGREARRAVARGQEEGAFQGESERVTKGLGSVGPARAWGRAVPCGARLGADRGEPGQNRGTGGSRRGELLPRGLRH